LKLLDNQLRLITDNQIQTDVGFEVPTDLNHNILQENATEFTSAFADHLQDDDDFNHFLGQDSPFVSHIRWNMEVENGDEDEDEGEGEGDGDGNCNCDDNGDSNGEEIMPDDEEQREQREMEESSQRHWQQVDDEEIRLLFAELGLDFTVDEGLEHDTEECTSFSKIHHENTKYYPGAAADYGEGTTFAERFKNDQFRASRDASGNLYYPFASWKEWEFTNVLMRLHCPLSEKTELLQTQVVSTY
jgi:hypothetical protein